MDMAKNLHRIYALHLADVMHWRERVQQLNTDCSSLLEMIVQQLNNLDLRKCSTVEQIGKEAQHGHYLQPH